MTASILKQVPSTFKVLKKAIYSDKTQPANCCGNPLYQAAKRHLNLIKGITPKICRSCFVLINCVLLNLSCVWILPTKSWKSLAHDVKPRTPAMFMTLQAPQTDRHKMAALPASLSQLSNINFF